MHWIRVAGGSRVLYSRGRWRRRAPTVATTHITMPAAAAAGSRGSNAQRLLPRRATNQQTNPHNSCLQYHSTGKQWLWRMCLGQASVPWPVGLLDGARERLPPPTQHATVDYARAHTPGEVVIPRSPGGGRPHTFSAAGQCQQSGLKGRGSSMACRRAVSLLGWGERASQKRLGFVLAAAAARRGRGKSGDRWVCRPG